MKHNARPGVASLKAKKEEAEANEKRVEGSSEKDANDFRKMSLDCSILRPFF